VLSPDRLRQGSGESRRSEAKADWRLLGATAGIVVFLGTCLMGHPLLVREVTAVFFMQLALAASLGGSVLLGSGRLQPARKRLKYRTAG